MSALSSSASSNNVPYIYALENNCQPCQAMYQMAGSVRGGGGNGANVQMANSSQVQIIGPVQTQQMQISAAVNMSQMQNQPVTPQLTRMLAGYNGGIRTATLSSL